MKLKTFLRVKKVAHWLLFCISVVLSVLLFIQMGTNLSSSLIYAITGAGLELVKIVLLLDSKRHWVVKKKYFTAVMMFILYTVIALFSAAATLGYNQNQIKRQSFSATLANVEQDSLYIERESILTQIRTKTKQQEGLPPDYITASDRLTEQINELREDLSLVNEQIQALPEIKVDSSDTFTGIGELPWIQRSGNEILSVLLMVLVVLIELSLMVTAGQIEEEDVPGFLEIKKEKAPPKVKKEVKATGCETCGAYRLCKRPKVKLLGEGKKKIMIVLDRVTKREDTTGELYEDSQAQYLFSLFDSLGVHPEDVWVTHAVQCYQPDNEAKKIDVSPQSIAGCHYRLMADIKRLKPEKIFVAGPIAMKTLYHNRHSGRFSFARYDQFVGFTIPDQELEALVVPIYSPYDAVAELERRKSNLLKYKPGSTFHTDLWRDNYLTQTDSFRLYDKFLRNHIAKGLLTSWEKHTIPETQILSTPEEIQAVLRKLLNSDEFGFDIETTGLKPYREGHEIVTWGFSDGNQVWAFEHPQDERTRRLLTRVMTSDAKKYGWNIQYENIWIKHFLGVWVKNWHYDGMVGSHILDNRSGITSLKFQTFVELGIAGYDSEIDPFLEAPKKGGNEFNNIKKAPRDRLLRYNGEDAYNTIVIGRRQKKTIDEHPVIHRGYQLFHDGQNALAKLTFRGFRIDEIQLEKNFQEVDKIALVLQDKIMKAKEIQGWDNFNPASPKHLIELFYDRLGFPVIEKTNKGQPSTSSDVLMGFYEARGLEIAKDIAEYKTAVQTRDTFLGSIKRETWDGVVHPGFMLNMVSSYRSSGGEPNLQNINKRDPFAVRMVRGVFKPRPGYVIVDVDYKSLEAYRGCDIHKDRTMIRDLMDPTADPHRDTACDLFLCQPDDVDKDVWKKMRNAGKTANFSLQYGSGPTKFAHALWHGYIDNRLKKHLDSKGIDTYDKWYEHCKAFYDKYWGVRYGDLKQWRETIWGEYVNNGVIHTKTGFKLDTMLSKNQIGNFPIQGSSFHLLLKGLIKFVNIVEEMGLDAHALGEIHDSVQIEVKKEIVDQVIPLIEKCFVTDIKEEESWVQLPLAMSGEVYEDTWASHIEGSEFKLGDVEELVA